MRKFYAGIGSRKTPDPVLEQMFSIAHSLRALGWLLRSGHADRADQAFEAGAGPLRAQIMLPWDGYNGAKVGQVPYLLGATQAAEEIAAQIHPAWDRCSQGARKLHARNVTIMGGLMLNEPVKFVVCWTKDGKATGGTGQALRIAELEQIPVFNLYHQDALRHLIDFVEGLPA